MGWDTVAWCEWNEFGQKVLRHHFPEAEGFGDITKTDFKKYANTIDIVTGGFPCQPYSLNGKRKGKEDERHLWPEMLRAIREIQPRWIIGENVPGLVTWDGGLVFNEVQSDLEAEGFEVFPPVILPACGIGALHQRDRVWFTAYSESNGNNKREKPYRGTELPIRSNIIHEFCERFANANKEYFKTAICIGDNGISTRLDGITVSKWRDQSLKAAGNAIVPQMAYQIYRVIELLDAQLSEQNVESEPDVWQGKKEKI